MAISLQLGVKTDMIEYRYSHEWLFRLLAEEGIRFVQLGTHFELYQLPDEFFHQLRKQADDAGVVIDSLFTAHRELGGFFREEPGYEQVARKNFERYIQVGGILGARSVGSNPGAVMRDRMGTKAKGLACYLKHMKDLMHWADQCGVEWLTIEPMSCLAEPPTRPDEIAAMGRELTDYHQANPESTAKIGYCTDIAHGYADQDGRIVEDHFQLFEACVPWLYEVHLKNTDSMYSSTFGFTAEERDKGIIDVPEFRELLLAASDRLPVTELTGYLEIGGPKLGRDYSDHLLEQSLRDSLRYLKTAFLEKGDSSMPTVRPPAREDKSVLISPSMMCVDPLNFESALRRVEALGVDMLHMDIMDGHFVPNAPMGISVLEALGPKTHLPIDVHLMVDDNDFFIELMRDMRIDQISVHVESCTHLDRTLTRIRELGAQAGVAINPATPLQVLDYILDRIDYVLVMTVNPGFAGQKMTPASIGKIADCRRMLDERGHASIPIQVDGNVSFENIPGMVAAGGVNLVAGTSSIFHKSATWSENCEKMHSTIADGLSQRADPPTARFFNQHVLELGIPESMTNTMDAIVLHGVSDLRYEQVPVPEIEAGKVRVRIGFCGVCGSDIPRCFSKGTYHFPTICGHEFAGTIEACGGGVSKFQVGDRVAVFPLIWNDDHPACEQGKYAQSDGYDYLGSRSDGAFSEYVIAPERNLIRVPDNVSLEEAAMTEPAAVALHAVRRAALRLGDTVAVFGLGPIGLMVAQWARAMASQVVLFDILPEKLELARSLGFQHVHDSRTDDPIEVTDAITGGRGVHVSIEGAGVPPTCIWALQVTRRGGRCVLLGNPAADVTLPAALISQCMRREIDILGTWNSDYSVFADDDDWRTVLEAMSHGTLDLKPLISHRVPLSGGIAALEMIRDQTEFYAKVLIHPNQLDQP